MLYAILGLLGEFVNMVFRFLTIIVPVIQR